MYNPKKGSSGIRTFQIYSLQDLGVTKLSVYMCTHPRHVHKIMDQVPTIEKDGVLMSI